MIVLDTHALIWLVDSPGKLSKKASAAINGEFKTKGQILVSAISVWETYLLVKKGTLELSIDVDVWFSKIEELPFLQFVPVDNKIAAKSVMLPSYSHKDPADRMIIATALQTGARLVTSDKGIRNYEHVKTTW